MKITYKNGAATCYSVEVAGISSTGGTGPITMTFKNSSGSTIAVGTVDTSTNAVSITCTGSTAVVLNANCDTASYAGASPSTATCTTGTCTP